MGVAEFKASCDVGCVGIPSAAQIGRAFDGLANPAPTPANPPVANPTPDASSTADTTDSPPIIQINADNPAIIQVGDTYTDLGATITGPQADLNLGITTYVNETEMSPLQIDTSTAASAERWTGMIASTATTLSRRVSAKTCFTSSLQTRPLAPRRREQNAQALQRQRTPQYGCTCP